MFELKLWMFWPFYAGGGDTGYLPSKRCFSSECIVSNIREWRGPLAVSADRSQHLKVGYK